VAQSLNAQATEVVTSQRDLKVNWDSTCSWRQTLMYGFALQTFDRDGFSVEYFNNQHFTKQVSFEKTLQ